MAFSGPKKEADACGYLFLVVRAIEQWEPLEKALSKYSGWPSLGNLSFPEPGPYTMNAWALDNVDDKLLSPMVTVDFDRLPSDLFEEGICDRSSRSRFPRTTEDSGLAKFILNTNRKVFGLKARRLVYRPSGFEQGQVWAL